MGKSMRYSETEFRKQMKEFQKTNQHSPEWEAELNILGFINTIHNNRQDFYRSSFDSHFYGDIELWFKKDIDRLFGYCRVLFTTENLVKEYIFTDQGFEPMDRVVFDN